MVKCAGPASADTAHGMTRFSNARRNTNGKAKNTTTNTKYQSSGTTAKSGLNRVTCHANSSATAHTSATADNTSTPVQRATPSSSTTSSMANPKIGDGFAIGI